MTLDSALGSQMTPTEPYTYSSLKSLSLADLEKLKSSLEKRIAEITQRNIQSPFGDRYDAEGKLIPRPPNSFILFTREIRADEMNKARKLKEVDSNLKILTVANESLARRWRGLDDKTKLCWKVMSLQNKYQTMEANPWFRFLRAEKKKTKAKEKDTIKSFNIAKKRKRINGEAEVVCQKKIREEKRENHLMNTFSDASTPDEDGIFADLVPLLKLTEQGQSYKSLPILCEEEEISPSFSYSSEDESNDSSIFMLDSSSTKQTSTFYQSTLDEEEEESVYTRDMSFEQEFVFPELEEKWGTQEEVASGGLHEEGALNSLKSISSQSVCEDTLYSGPFTGADRTQLLSSYLLSPWSFDQQLTESEDHPKTEEIFGKDLFFP
jgi:hypothetical protein